MKMVIMKTATMTITPAQAWNFVILGAWPLGLQRGNYFKGTKTTCQGIKCIS